MPCPTCDHTLARLGTIEGRTHYHCGRCGTHRILCGHGLDGAVYHDTVPSLVEYLRGFVRMIEPGPAGRYLRNAAETAGILESINRPGDRRE